MLNYVHDLYDKQPVSRHLVAARPVHLRCVDLDGDRSGHLLFSVLIMFQDLVVLWLSHSLFDTKLCKEIDFIH